MSGSARANAPQLRASDPATSAWVNANAGSGKTHVLVDRVLRLLLTGVEPSRIMCLTFTKAAAAEMSNRLFERLSGWVAMTPAALTESLAALGTGKVSADDLRLARQLFTRALETPGGLKIQTIHAFCERVLQAFPIEAGIVPRFTVLDDRSSADLLQQARDAVLSRAMAEPHSQIGRAAATVVQYAQADAFDEMMRQLLTRRSLLTQISETPALLEQAMAMLRQTLGLSSQETEASVVAGLAIDIPRYRQLAAVLQTSLKTDIERAEAIGNILRDPAADLRAFRDFYFTKEDRPRALKSFPAAAVKKAHSWAADFIADEQQRLTDGRARLADLERLMATRALLVLGSAVIAGFEVLKRQRGAYDFDDLIARTSELLATRPDAAWVLFKLDGGIAHLLVDEAQDTSPAQWEIIRSLTNEFFAGAGRPTDQARTVFAVGDRKQSIYSFQGADPDVFAAVHDAFAEDIRGAGQQLRDVDLTVSFRSAPTILAAVDLVFRKDSVARQGLDGRSSRDWLHTSNRPEAAGTVEVWPLVEPEEAEAPDPWSLPVDREPSHSPRRRLAARIATKVAAWIGKRQLGSTGRAVAPRDILILVRRRDTLFEAMIRELRQRGVPVAGADRLKLGDNIAVLDLLATARCALMPEDDLSLAAVLKSPVITQPLSEEQLMSIAIDRGQRSLWEALCASADPACLAATAELGQLMVQAPRMRPYDFLAAILVRARMRMVTRLGSEANDALDALLDQALNFEEAHPATLAGFVTWFESGETEIARNMELAAGEVRIMTVHGAKGLEAPIVILPDTVSTPDTSQKPALMMAGTGNAGEKMPLWTLAGSFESPALARLRAEAEALQHEEYRRLLYVAMTRARDELYVCGARSSRQPSAICWHELVKEGLQGHLRDIGGDEGWRMGADPVAMAAQHVSPRTPFSPPGWVGQPAAEGRAEETLRRASATTTTSMDVLARRGNLIHRILETLPDLPPAAWAGHADEMARRAGLPEAAAMLSAFLDSPLMAEILGGTGLSEIPLLVDIPELGGSVSGRIDRLLVGESRILAVDYKTSSRVPQDAADADPAYLQQMAAYRAALRRIHPGTPVELALLYTSGPRLLVLPDALLDRVFDQIAVNRP